MVAGRSTHWRRSLLGMSDLAQPKRIDPMICEINLAAHVVNAGRRAVTSHPELDFSYVDRGPDCMRTAPGQPLEDETPSRRAILIDLLLQNANDQTPDRGRAEESTTTKTSSTGS